MNVKDTLIKDFVNAINTKPEKKTAMYYGEIVEVTNDSGVKKAYVHLDGSESDIKTPIVEGTEVLEGDRVLVTIENHQAVVLANITSPASARTAKNYMDLSEEDEGLVIGALNDENNNYNVLIKADGVYIRDGQDVMAIYGGDGTYIYADGEPAAEFTAEGIQFFTDLANYAKFDPVTGEFTSQSLEYLHLDNLEANFAHITNGVIDNATIDHADINDLDANYAHITNGVIDNATIDHADINDLDANYAHITNGVIDNATIDHADINDLEANYAHITEGVIDNAKIGYADVENLESNYAHITNGTIDNATIGYADVNDLNAHYASITNGVITNATIDQAKVNNLQSNYAHITNGFIDNADIKEADVENLTTKYAHITNGYIDNADIKEANVENLTSKYAHITNGTIDNAKIGYADVNGLNAHYAEIDMANVNNAWIENGVVKDAAISDAQIIGVSANKLTAGTIDANEINVANLRAKNLIVEKMNGQPILGGYELVNKNSTGYSGKNPSNEGWYEYSNGTFVASTDTTVNMSKAYYKDGTQVALYDQTYIDGLENNLQQQIDGAIETFTGSVVPTLVNYPAVDWTSAQMANHVGDIYYVVNAGNDYDGYSYRFSYDNSTSTYSWRLIRDSGVTAALADISDLQTFQSNTESWITETDDGLETIRTNHTSLSGVVNKTVKSSTQLWFTKANTTAPSAPTSEVTSDSTAGNAWRRVVPTYNSSYPYYFYCWQYKFVDNTFGWSAVIYDQATTESEERARTGVANAATADGKAVSAQNTANANIKSSVMLWFTKANDTAPSKPTSVVTTSNAATANAWNLLVPTYNSSYPHYFYCYQQQKGDGTYQWTDIVYDRATTETQSTARATSSSLANYITTNDAALQSLKNQVDGQLEIWYGTVAPTTTNTPASGWSSTTDKDNHIGDMYYNTTNGKVYQWTKSGSTYSWTEIPESSAAAALAAAQDAQATADGKRRVFTSQPTVPYDIGDLWVNGDEVKYATVKRTTGSYTASEWAQTATDDTVANANIKSSVQLWRTKSSSTAISKPYTDGSTSYINSTTTNGDTWTTVVPTYNSSYPYYHYCYQQQRGDGKYQWTTPVYDDATSIAMKKAQEALPASTFTTFESTTFKNVKDTVDEQSSTITNLSSRVDTKADSSTVTTLSNTVSSVSQTATSNSSKLSQLTTTLGTNADGTTKTGDVMHRMTAQEQDLSGFKTTVSQTYTTKTEFNNLEIGGTNLLKKVPLRNESGSYESLRISLTENLKAGQTYTLQFWDVNVSHTGKNASTLGISVYWGGGYINLVPFIGTQYFTNGHSDYLTATFTITDSQASGQSTSNPWLSIFNSPPQASGTMSMSIGKWKIEYGNKATDWSPCPDDYSTTAQMNSAIEQKAGEISLSVAESVVENLEIGGRNLYKSFTTFPQSKQSITGPVTYTYDSSTGTYQLTATASNTNFKQIYVIDAIDNVQELLGKTVTLSATAISSTRNDATPIVYFYGERSNGTTWTRNIQKDRLVDTFTIPDDLATIGFVIRCDQSCNETVGEIATFKGIKLEKGDKATDWSPAPEDLENYADSAVTSFASRFSVTPEAISSEVQSTQNGETLVTRINQTSESVKIEAEHIEIDGTAIFTNNDFKTSFSNSQNAYTVLWDAGYGTAWSGGEARICKKDPITGEVSSTTNGWVMWNGIKRTVPSIEWNPDSNVPFNIPIYLVLRLSSASSTTGTIYPVWYADLKWNYFSQGAKTDWTWVEATDIVMASCVEPASEALFTDCVIYDPPWNCRQVTTYTVTASGANALASEAKSTADSAAPKTSAISRSQRIYWRATSASGKPSANTTWLSTSGTGYGNWSLNIPQLTSGTTKYPFLYTAVQTQTVSQQAAGTTCSCSEVLLDDTTTIIDGGNIITGTVTANQIAVHSISAAQLTVSDSTNLATVNEKYEPTYSSGINSSWQATTSNGYITKKTVSNDYIAVTDRMPSSFKTGDELYYEFYAKSASTSTINVGIWGYKNSGEYATYIGGTSHSLTTTEAFYSGTLKLDNGNVWNSDVVTYWMGIVDSSSTKVQIYIRKLIIRRKSEGKLIVDGSITADKIDATNINASNTLTIGALSTATQNDILNSNVQVGGTNLLLDTGDLTKWNKETGVSVEWDSTEGMYKIIDSTHTGSRWGIYKDLAVEPNTTYTCSMTGKKAEYDIGFGIASTATSPYSGYPTANVTYTTTKNRLSYTFTTGADHVLARIYICIWPTATGSYGYALKPKIEKGNKATDWSPAPEDVQTEIDSKKSVHTLDSNYSSAVLRATYAQILGWSAEGKPDTWNVTSTSGIKVDDTVRIALKVSDFSDAIVYLVTTVTAVNSAINISTISHGLDSTVIDGGRILANSVGANQIDASSINASKSLTIGAMSAEATKSIINSENLFGYGSQLESLNGVQQSGFEIVTEDGYKCAHASGALQTTKYITSCIKFTPKPKETVTISAYVKIKNIVYGTTNPMCEFYLDGQTIDGGWRSSTIDAVYVDGVPVTPNERKFPTYISDTNWHHIAFVRTWENYTFTGNLRPAVYLRDCTGDLYIRNIKYERGSTYTDWTPAPMDLETQWEVPSSLIANENSTHCTMSLSGNNITITRTTSGSRYGCYCDIPCKPNTFYSASIRIISGSDFDINFGGDYGSGSVWSGMGVSHRRTSNGKQYAATATATSSTQSYLRIYIASFTQNATMTFTDLTVYEGDDIGLLDKNAYDSSKVATDYVTQIDSNGIWVTPSGKKPASNGNPVANTTTGTKIDGTGVGIYKDGNCMAQYGENTKIYSSSGTQLLHLGYDYGKNASGSTSSTKLPYYSIGTRTGAVGNYSIAEGYDSTASGYASHAEGSSCVASSDSAHAEGSQTLASNGRAHAEGEGSEATGLNSHAEGTYSHATQNSAHSEGYTSTASGLYSHAQNEGTTAQGKSQTVIGRYNVAQGTADSYSNSDHAFIIGNGTSSTHSNALTVDWNGNVDAKGGYKVNSYTPIVVETISEDNISINANSLYTWNQTNLSKTGYTLAGVVGYGVTNATSSGSNQSICNVYYCRKNSTNSIQMLIRNVGSASSASANTYQNAKVKLTADLLWVATGMI